MWGDGNYDTHCRFWFDRAAARTSDRKRFTSSTMSFFIPSIESSSSKKKSNFYELTVTHQFWPDGDEQTMTHSWADRLVRRVMPDSKVRVLERLVAGDAFRRIKVEHLGEQIEREWVRVRKHLRERHAWPDGQRTDVVLCLRVQG